MKIHSAKELRYVANFVDVDATTILLEDAGAGIEDLSGRRLEQAQLQCAETTHMILLRYVDGVTLPPQGFITITDPGNSAVTKYIVDYVLDPRLPRPRVWTEVYAHVLRTK